MGPKIRAVNNSTVSAGRNKMSGNSVINLGELSKPATVLIEKIADAVGGIFKPYQIKRLAKAEAEAELIHAESGG